MRVPLLGGMYQAKSIIADAQRAVNLYAEMNPKDGASPVTTYQTPGLDLLVAGPLSKPVRCTYRASDGQGFVVIGPNVYYVDSGFGYTLLGTIADLPTNVSMQDNGLVIILVDGSSTGHAIDLAAHTFGTISSTNFFGATRVDYLDTFFLLNRPGTNQWYISLSNVTYAMLVTETPTPAFDPLDIAAKVGYPDPLQTLICMHREVWLVGQLTTEIWYNAGTPDFTFGTMPGAFVEHGTIAPYSIATQDLSVYFLTQDNQGRSIVMRGASYVGERISTHAIENEIQSYGDVSDAIGCVYQQEGHTFYVLIFPSASKTWVFDQATELWHQRAWTDADGNLVRHRINCCANMYGKIVVGDWQNGNLYAFNLSTYTDVGNPISRIRSFPHLQDNLDRVMFTSFIADMQAGDAPNYTPDNPPQVSLRWSDNRGVSYGNAVMQSMGAGGEYLTNIQWSRLAMARDRVFELSWSDAVNTAVNGAFVDFMVSKS